MGSDHCPGGSRHPKTWRRQRLCPGWNSDLHWLVDREPAFVLPPPTVHQQLVIDNGLPAARFLCLLSYPTFYTSYQHTHIHICGHVLFKPDMHNHYSFYDNIGIEAAWSLSSPWNIIYHTIIQNHFHGGEEECIKDFVSSTPQIFVLHKEVILVSNFWSILMWILIVNKIMCMS